MEQYTLTKVIADFLLMMSFAELMSLKQYVGFWVCSDCSDLTTVQAGHVTEMLMNLITREAFYGVLLEGEQLLPTTIEEQYNVSSLENSSS